MGDPYQWPLEVVQKVETHLLIEVGTIVSLYIPEGNEPSRQYRVVEVLNNDPRHYTLRMEMLE